MKFENPHSQVQLPIVKYDIRDVQKVSERSKNSINIHSVKKQKNNN